MYNDLFSIGPLTVHGYGLMIAIGVLAGLFVAEARAKKRGMNSDILYYMMPFCVILGSDEIDANQVTIKNMNTGEQKTTDLQEAISIINNQKELLNKAQYVNMQ